MFRKYPFVIIFLLLLTVFITLWIIKTPASAQELQQEEPTPWWEAAVQSVTAETPQVDPQYVLDPEIPANYIPVMNMKDVYAVADEDGAVVKYRRRTQGGDGTWYWEDLDPNIPLNYVAVEGLDNVYRVQNEDGTVSYLRYTRNEDNTFFFTEVDEHGNPLDSVLPSGIDSSIPENYVPVGNGIYAVYNEHGVLITYVRRSEDASGNVSWAECESPFIDGGLNSSSNIGSGNASSLIPDNGGLDLPSSSGNNNNPSQGSNENVVVNIITGSTGEKQGYTETETFTYTDTVDGWIVIYEVVVIRTYDTSGELVSTHKEGPTELNRFPATEFNESLIPGYDPSTGEYTPPSGA